MSLALVGFGQSDMDIISSGSGRTFVSFASVLCSTAWHSVCKWSACGTVQYWEERSRFSRCVIFKFVRDGWLGVPVNVAGRGEVHRTAS